MTKAESKAMGGLLVVALVIGGPIYLVKSIGETVGWQNLGVVVVLAIAAIISIAILRSTLKSNRVARELEARKAALLEKYGDSDLVDRILAKTIWQGQSEEQLRDSLGAPVDIDEKIYKTKTSRTWKYQQVSAKRFGLKITLENGMVVGWDHKG